MPSSESESSIRNDVFRFFMVILLFALILTSVREESGILLLMLSTMFVPKSFVSIKNFMQKGIKKEVTPKRLSVSCAAGGHFPEFLVSNIRG